MLPENNETNSFLSRRLKYVISDGHCIRLYNDSARWCNNCF